MYKRFSSTQKNMKKTIYFIGILFFVYCLTNCSSGKKALEKGNYYNACLTAIERLRSNPNKKSSQEVLREAYPLALSEIQRTIDNTLIGNSPNKYAIVFSNYEMLNNLSNQIHRCPAAKKIITNPKDFTPESNKYRTLAAEESYLLGQKELQLGTRMNAKLAYNHFINCDSYTPHYKDVRLKIEEALDLATLKVVFERAPLPNRYQLSADFFYNNVESEIVKSNRNKFIQYFTPQDASAYKIKADQIIVFEFDDFIIGNTRETSDTKEIRKDSVLTGTVMINGVKRNVFGTVKAYYTLNKREVLSQGTLSVRVINAQTNSIIDHKKFSGEYVWFSSWADYKGDERALSSEQIKTTNKKPLPPPPPQDLFVEFTRPIFSQVTSYLDNFYRRY